MDLALSDLLINFLLDNFTLELCLSLSSGLFVIDNETSPHLKRIQIANQVLAAIKLFLVRVGQIFDKLLAILLTLLLVRLILNNLVFLALLPVNVLNLVLLHFEVVAFLPVLFTLLVFEGVECSELLLDSVNLFSDFVGLFLSLVLLGIGQFELLSDNIDLLVENIFVLLDSLNLVPNLLLLSNKNFYFLLKYLVAFCLWNRSFQQIDIFDESFFSLRAHRCRGKTPLSFFHCIPDLLLSRAVALHDFLEIAFLHFQVLQLGDNFTHVVLVLSLVGTYALRSINFLGKFALPRVSPSGSPATLTNVPALVDQIVLLLALFRDLGILGLHVAVEVCLGGLLEQVLFGWEFGNFRLSRKHYLFPLWPLHIMVLVDPAILILLLLIVTIVATPVLVVATLASTTAASSSLLLFLFLLGISAPFSIICCLSCSLGSALLRIRRIFFGSCCLSCSTPTTTATSTACSLRPSGIAAIGGIVISAFGFVIISATTAETLRLFLNFRHCLFL